MLRPPAAAGPGVEEKMRLGRYMDETIKEYSGILLGAILFGIAYSWFLFPFRISPGGVGGIAQVLYRLTGVTESLWLFAFNIPLFAIGWKFVGRQFGLRSFVGTMLANAMCWVFKPSHLSFLPDYETIVHNIAPEGHLPRLAVFLDGSSPTDILLASLAGSTILGLGLGIIFRFRGSTGGTDIPVAVLRKYTGVSISTGYWMVESIIIVAAGAALGNPTLVIWAYLNLFLSTRMTDLAAEGMPYVKAVMIITSKGDRIRDAIYEQLDRGVTFLKAEGGSGRRPKDAVYVCVHQRQVRALAAIVRSVDPHAFVVLHDAYDVMGYGFRRRTLDYDENGG
ncbi:YitT family protein [Candidatus Fermentibacteria bacterium]|nr:YitT family protein [Candidatus Fermentibacteria bacterium]